MTCLCPLFQRIRMWTFELVHRQSPWLAWVAPIAHARLNRSSLTWCTQLDMCLVACTQLDTSFSSLAVFQCPTFHAPLLIWIYIFFLKGNIARQFLPKKSAHNALDLIFLYMHTPHNTDRQYDQHFERAPRKPLWVLRISAFCISVTWTFLSFSPLIC